MVESAVGIELKSVRARCGDGLVGDIKDRQRLGLTAFDSDLPGLFVEARPQRPDLAHVDEALGDPAAPHQFDNTVGNVPLRDPVQRERHALSRENDTVAVEPDVAETDQIQRLANPRCRGTGRIRAGFGEMAGQHSPQGLNGRVEHAAARLPVAVADFEQSHEIGGRRRDTPSLFNCETAESS